MTASIPLPSCRVVACAKVNLDLRVRGVRPDGYHELATVFQSIDLADVLFIEPWGGTFEIECNDPGVPRDSRNLVWRAADAFGRLAGLDVPTLRVRIDKTIPAQAGLGGGSADAAALLRGLNAMLGHRVSREDLVTVAATLGADVPFMLVGGTALGTGRGDVLRRLPDLPPYDVVIVHPGFGVSTADAYRWYDAADGQSGAGPEWPERTGGWAETLAACANDLEPPVAKRHPEIAALVEVLRAAGARVAAMTGSGSAAFGLFDPGELAARAARRLAGSGRVVRVARTVGASEFDRLSEPALVGPNG